MTVGRRPERARAAALAAALALFAFSAPAAAADVGVVAPRSPFVERVVLELEQLGFTVARARSVAEAKDPAVLEIEGSEIALHGAPRDGARAKQQLAATMDPLAVAEEVRARLLPLIARPAPTPAPVIAAAPDAPDAPVPVPPPAAPTPERFLASAGLGALVGVSQPGLGVTAGLAFFPGALRFRATSFGIGVFGLATLVPESIGTSAGSADVRTLAVGADALVRHSLTPALAARGGVGIAACHVTFAGRAAAPLTSRDESATTASPSALLGGEYRFGRLGLYAEARAGLAAPSVTVRFAGESVAQWGGPWALLGGGAALAF